MKYLEYFTATFKMHVSLKWYGEHFYLNSFLKLTMSSGALYLHLLVKSPLKYMRDCHGHECIVVGFTSTYAIWERKLLEEVEESMSMITI